MIPNIFCGKEDMLSKFNTIENFKKHLQVILYVTENPKHLNSELGINYSKILVYFRICHTEIFIFKIYATFHVLCSKTTD